MRVLVASGDRNGALRHARFFEALSSAELGLPADRDVLDLAASIRRDASDAELRTRATIFKAGDNTAHASRCSPSRTSAWKPMNDEQRRWRDALAEEMIGELSRDLRLRVLARTASFALGAAPRTQCVARGARHCARTRRQRATYRVGGACLQLGSYTSPEDTPCGRSGSSGRWTTQAAQDYIALTVAARVRATLMPGLVELILRLAREQRRNATSSTLEDGVAIAAWCR
jgi:hypothetical protein